MHLIIVPSVNDSVWRLRCALPLWWVRGIRASVYPWNWHRSPYHPGGGRFGKYLKHHQPAIILGSGAGGLVAIRALFEWPDRVARVAVVATSVRGRHGSIPLMNTATRDVTALLNGADAAMLQRITTVTSPHDKHVLPGHSAIKGANVLSIPALSHGSLIMRCTVFPCAAIQEWAKPQHRSDDA